MFEGASISYTGYVQHGSQDSEKPLKREIFGSRLAPFKNPDFRWLWFGALLSFTGSWIQNIAQGWLVFELTGSEQKLAYVSFLSSLPVAIFGPIAGAYVDVWNKRKLLIACQILYGCGALTLACSVQFQFVSYQLIMIIALANGIVGSFEMPARQSLLSLVVPKDQIPAAVPLQAMTFNMARIVGPAIGGILLAHFGPKACYFANSVSYFGLIIAVISIKAHIGKVSTRMEPIKDLIKEGMLYTMRNPRLRTLLVLEATTSMFGIAYIPFIPAYAKEVLHYEKEQLSRIYIAVGIGAISALITMISLSKRNIQSTAIRFAMTTLGIALIALSQSNSEIISLPLFTVLGACSVMQFNSTNTLFQLLAPEAIRGRVIAMHIWALSGLSPMVMLPMGYLAEIASTNGVMLLGGCVTILISIYGWTTLNNERKVLAPI